MSFICILIQGMLTGKKKLGNQLKMVIFNDARNYEYGCTSFLATAQVRKQRVDNMCNIVMQICGIGFCIVKEF